MTRRRQGTPLSRGRRNFRGHRQSRTEPSRVLRITLWKPDLDQYAAPSMSFVVAEDEIRDDITLEDIAAEFRMKTTGSASGSTEQMDVHTFVTTQIVRIADTSDVERNVQLALTHQDLATETNQAILFFYTAFLMSQKVKTGGVVAMSNPAPMSPGRVEEVLRQLTLTDMYKAHTVLVPVADGMVTLDPEGEVRFEGVPAV